MEIWRPDWIRALAYDILERWLIQVPRWSLENESIARVVDDNRIKWRSIGGYSRARALAEVNERCEKVCDGPQHIQQNRLGEIWSEGRFLGR